MKKIVFLSLFLVSTTNYFFSQQVIGGVTLPSKIVVNESNLFYNGGGIRSKYGFNLYVASLYLKRPSKDATKVITDNANMAIHISIISDKVTREKFIETVNDGFSRATSGKATEAQKTTFKGFFSDAFKKGDKIRLEYVTGSGLKVYKNDVYKGVINDLEFKKALFSIWLGTNPADAGLKNKLLGIV